MPADRTISHGLPLDPSLPGMSTALEASSMLALLRPHFEHAGIVLEELRVERFRYRPGKRLVVLYVGNARDVATGYSRATFVAGRIHTDRAQRVASREHDARATLGGALTRIRLPEIGMKAEVFPHDRRLPALTEFVGRPSLRALDFLRSGIGLPHLAATDFGVDPVRYRAGLSATLACRYRGQDHDGFATCFIKIASGEEAYQGQEAARQVAAAMAAMDPYLSIELPTATMDGDRIMLFEMARGRTVASLVEAGEPMPELARRVAHLLATLHRLDTRGLPETFTADVTEKIDRALAMIAWASPDLGYQVTAVGKLARKCVEAPVRAITHRDMKPDHIFVDGKRTALIDNGSICVGNPLTDLGALEARLGLIVARRSASRAGVDALIAAIRASYFERVPGSWQSLLPAARAYGALLVSTHVIQSITPGWRKIVEEELSAALHGIA